MKILVDMNLSPRWCQLFARQGWQSVHWSAVGDPRAPDTVVLAWALENDHVLLTHDLDFSAVLAATQATGPSVVQIRVQNVTPEAQEDLFVGAMRQFETVLDVGAIVVVDAARARARVLPLNG